METYATNSFLKSKNLRPFIISRSSTLGSNKYGFHWTGDNYASWDFLKGGPGTFRIRQHKFIPTKELRIEDMELLQQKTFDVIYSDLVNDKKYMKDTNRKNERKNKS